MEREKSGTFSDKDFQSGENILKWQQEERKRDG